MPRGKTFNSPEEEINRHFFFIVSGTPLTKFTKVLGWIESYHVKLKFVNDLFHGIFRSDSLQSLHEFPG